MPHAQARRGHEMRGLRPPKRHRDGSASGCLDATIRARGGAVAIASCGKAGHRHPPITRVVVLEPESPRSPPWPLANLSQFCMRPGGGILALVEVPAPRDLGPPLPWSPATSLRPTSPAGPPEIRRTRVRALCPGARWARTSGLDQCAGGSLVATRQAGIRRRRKLCHPAVYQVPFSFSLFQPLSFFSGGRRRCADGGAEPTEDRPSSSVRR